MLTWNSLTILTCGGIWWQHWYKGGKWQPWTFSICLRICRSFLSSGKVKKSKAVVLQFDSVARDAMSFVIFLHKTVSVCQKLTSLFWNGLRLRWAGKGIDLCRGSLIDVHPPICVEQQVWNSTHWLVSFLIYIFVFFKGIGLPWHFPCRVSPGLFVCLHFVFFSSQKQQNNFLSGLIVRQKWPFSAID